MRWMRFRSLLRLMPVNAAMRIIPLLLAGIVLPGAVLAADDGSALPFAAAPSASIAAPRLQDSKHQRRVEPSHLPKDAGSALIVELR